MRESVTTKAGWQAVVRWIGQEQEAQARDRVLAAHRQAARGARAGVEDEEA